MATIIYTDGSARGNPGPGGWGAIIISDENVRELGGYESHTTNNRMELTAAIKALGSTATDEVTIYTDSEYVMKGITVWVHDWVKRGWRTAAKKPVLNQDLWQELLQLEEEKRVSWNYVRGHAGHALNERCDEIATLHADGKKVDLYEGRKDEYPVEL